MITYTDYGTFLNIDGKSIPKNVDNKEYVLALEQIKAGQAVVVPHVEPVASDNQKIQQELLIDFTLWDFVDATYRKRNGDSTKDDAIYARWKEIIGKYPQK